MIPNYSLQADHKISKRQHKKNKAAKNAEKKDECVILNKEEEVAFPGAMVEGEIRASGQVTEQRA